jgi:hypothetical protein
MIRRPDRTEDPLRVVPLGPPAVAVLRLLSLGRPEAAIVNEVGRIYRFHDPVASVKPKDIARVAFEAVKRPPLPATEAAFSDMSGVSPPEIRASADLASELLAGYASGEMAASRLKASRHDQTWKAMKYAEALLQEDCALGLRGQSDLRRELSKTESDRIDSLLVYWSVRSGPKTLEGWVAGWERVVQVVASRPSYELLEEFENGLRTRDLLEQAIDLLGPGTSSSLPQLVGLLDERFSESTIELSIPVTSDGAWRTRGWWWFRTPSTIGESFIERLRQVAPDAAREVASKLV